MRLSRYGVVGMALVVAVFVAILAALAPRPNQLDTSRRLAHLGRAIELYCQKHDGRLPPSFDALANEHLLHPDTARYLSGKVKYLAPGSAPDALPKHTIVALEDPADVAGQIRVSALLSDGNVLDVPADVVREPSRRAGVILRLGSEPDGQLTVIAEEPTTR